MMKDYVTEWLIERHDVTEKDYGFILAVFFGSAFFWTATYMITSVFMNTVMKDCMDYHKLSRELKADYLSRVVAALHAGLATILGFIAYLFLW